MFPAASPAVEDWATRKALGAFESFNRNCQSALASYEKLDNDRLYTL